MLIYGRNTMDHHEKSYGEVDNMKGHKVDHQEIAGDEKLMHDVCRV